MALLEEKDKFEEWQVLAKEELYAQRIIFAASEQTKCGTLQELKDASVAGAWRTCGKGCKGSSPIGQGHVEEMRFILNAVGSHGRVLTEERHTRIHGFKELSEGEKEKHGSEIVMV